MKNKARKHTFQKRSFPRWMEDRVAPDFWQIIRSRREDLGFTQAKVAEKLGLCPSTICAWENGQARRLPFPGKFWALADLLELSEDEMLEAAGYRGAYGPKAPSHLRVLKD